MKTSKERAESPEASPGKKATGIKKSGAEYIPNEEDIRRKAKEIFHNRISRGEHGDALQDWLEAEKVLRNSRNR